MTEACGSPPRHNSALSRHNTHCPCTWGPGCHNSGPCVSWAPGSSHHVSCPHSLTSEVAHPFCGDLVHQEVYLDQAQCWADPGMAAAELTGKPFFHQTKLAYLLHATTKHLFLLWRLLLLLSGHAVTLLYLR